MEKDAVTYKFCVVIPFHTPWEWTADYAKQTALELAKNSTVICYFKHTTAPKAHALFHLHARNIYFYEFIHLLPGERFNLIFSFNDWINTFIIRIGIGFLNQKKHFSRRLIWIFDPLLFGSVRSLVPDFQVIYDCVDYWRANPHLSRIQRSRVATEEQRLLRYATVVSVVSRVLYTLHKKTRKKLIVVPQGFRFSSFLRAKLPKRNTGEHISTIGYVGTISDRLNIPLLRSLAVLMPGCRFVLAGPIVDIEDQKRSEFISLLHKKLLSLPNVLYLGDVGKENVPGVISQFDIGMIPYRTDTRFTTYCYPMKLFEYFYMGKPIVSVPITELKRFPIFVRMGRTARDWRELIEYFLVHPLSVADRRAQRALAIENSWEKKVRAINAEILKTTVY